MAGIDIYAGLKSGTELVYEGSSYFLTTVTPDRRYMAMSSVGALLLMADPQTGIPGFPTVGMMRDAQRRRLLFIRSEPLEDPVRAAARAAGDETPKEVAQYDSWAPLRRLVQKAWDREPDDAKPMLSDAGLEAWIREVVDEAEIIARFGRMPVGTTLRCWVKTRGRKGDRRVVDTASRSGKVPRRRRVSLTVLTIARLHALAVNKTNGRKIATGFALFRRDVRRAAAGKQVVIDGVRVEIEPGVTHEPFGKEIFRLECRRAASRNTTVAAWNEKAGRAVWGGGGHAKEPTRFLEIVEQDDTPFSKYFLIDLENRVPVGPCNTCISVDVRTHCVIGSYIGWDSPSLSTWMSCVADGAVPKLVPERFRDAHPELADIFGHVGCYLYDNALQNVARAVEDAGGDLCQEVRLAGEGEATHKALVERTHQTIRSMMEELPGSSFDIRLMRKYGYDPEKHVVVTIEEFRVLFAEAIALYHVTKTEALGWRAPLDLWIEQMGLHGLPQPRDVDQYLRSIGDVDWVRFDRNGCSTNGLRYSDADFNEAFLADCAIAWGPSDNPDDPGFTVKMKSYPSDLGFVSVYNPHLRRLQDVPCTRRRYAPGRPLWLHERIQQHAKLLGAEFITKEEMLEAAAGFVDILRDIAPEAAARERRTMARLVDLPNVRRYLGDSVHLIKVQPSPGGMESAVRHDLRTEHRRDLMVRTERRPRGGENVRRDRREAAKERVQAEATARRGQRDAAAKGGAAANPKTGRRPAAPLRTGTFE